MTLAHIILGSVAFLLWIPVLIFFFRNFRSRHNPVSLAIATMVVLAILYVGPANFWILTGTADATWVLTVFNVLSIAAALHFFLAIRWSKHRFQDVRSSGK